jgi:hypothetical protein
MERSKLIWHLKWLLGLRYNATPRLSRFAGGVLAGLAMILAAVYCKVKEMRYFDAAAQQFIC